MRILVQGYYGHRNFGDDLFMCVIYERLKKFATKITFVVSDRKKLPECFSTRINLVETWSVHDGLIKRVLKKLVLLMHYAKSKTVIYGGGTFIQETNANSWKVLRNDYILNKLTKLCGGHVIGLGIGISTLSSYKCRKYAKYLLNTFDVVYFRDRHSLKLAENLTCPHDNRRSHFRLGCDLAYAVPPSWFREALAGYRHSTDINLAFNIIDKSKYYGFDSKDPLDPELLGKFVSSLLLHVPNLKVTLVGAQSTSNSPDVETMKTLHRILSCTYPMCKERIKLLVYSGNPLSLMKFLSQMDIVIASKLHLIIVAHMLGKKVLAIPYHKKIGQIMEELDINDQILDYYKMTMKDTISKVLEEIERLRGLSDPVEHVDIEASTCAVEEMFGTLTEFMSSSDSTL